VTATVVLVSVTVLASAEVVVAAAAAVVVEKLVLGQAQRGRVKEPRDVSD
jgi:hypothetical protein